MTEKMAVSSHWVAVTAYPGAMGSRCAHFNHPVSNSKMAKMKAPPTRVCPSFTLSGSGDANGCAACNCCLIAGRRMSHRRRMVSTMEAVTLPASGTWASLRIWFTRSANTSSSGKVRSSITALRMA